MQKVPSTTTAWLLTLAGILLLLCSIVIHWQMILVILGIKHVAPGGGEYMIAFLAGLPMLLVSGLLLGVASIRPRLRSLLAVVPLLFSVAGVLLWISGIITT
jgi:hypothetical protein